MPKKKNWIVGFNPNKNYNFDYSKAITFPAVPEKDYTALQKENKKQEKELNSLRAMKLAETMAKERITTLVISNDMLRLSNSHFFTENKKLKEECFTAMTACEIAEGENKSLEHTSFDLTTTIEKLQEEKKGLRKNLDSARKQNTLKWQLEQTAQTENKKLEEEIETREDRIEELRDSNLNYLADLEQARLEILEYIKMEKDLPCLLAEFEAWDYRALTKLNMSKEDKNRWEQKAREFLKNKEAK